METANAIERSLGRFGCACSAAGRSKPAMSLVVGRVGLDQSSFSGLSQGLEVGEDVRVAELLALLNDKEVATSRFGNTTLHLSSLLFSSHTPRLVEVKWNPHQDLSCSSSSRGIVYPRSLISGVSPKTSPHSLTSPSYGSVCMKLALIADIEV